MQPVLHLPCDVWISSDLYSVQAASRHNETMKTGHFDSGFPSLYTLIRVDGAFNFQLFFWRII